MRTVLLALVAASTLASGSVLAQQAGPQGNAERAKGKISMCIGCHGIPAYRNAFPEVYHVPMIAGQSPGYIVSALKAYKAGERNHGTMRSIAGGLSEDDMADIAAYYAGAKPRGK